MYILRNDSIQKYLYVHKSSNYTKLNSSIFFKLARIRIVSFK